MIVRIIVKVLVIHDGISGHMSQALAIAKALQGEEIKEIVARKNLLSFLPKIFSSYTFLLGANILKKLNLRLMNYSPDIIVSIGRKSLPYAIYSKKKFSKAKLVFLMPNGKIAEKYADLIFYHAYKNNNINDNLYVPIISSPHCISKKFLAESAKQWQNDFMHINKPIISIMIGGNAKGIKLTYSAIDELVSAIDKILHKVDGYLLVSTSRRTGNNNEIYLKGKLKNHIDNKKCYFWGYNENIGSARNPYIAMLYYSDYVILTMESISMISEACSLGSNVGVYIFSSSNFYAKRFIGFSTILVENKHAYFLKDFAIYNNRKPINSTEFITNKIKELLI